MGNPHPGDESLLTVDAVAERLGISKKTVLRLVQAKELPRIVIAKRCIRIKPSDLRDYQRRQTED